MAGAVSDDMLGGTSKAISRVLAILATLLFHAGHAHADGKVFGREVANTAGVQIPDQAAIIRWDPATKTQVLAIETRFIGRGEDFGWVVPLPSRPEIHAATEGTFPSVRAVFSPMIVRRDGAQVGFLLACAFVGLLAVLYLPRLGAFAAVATLLSFILLLMLPALGKARGGGRSPPDVLTHEERRVIGNYEVTTLESPRGEAVNAWLAEHGFVLPATAATVIKEYAEKGWCFAATRMARGVDEQSATGTPPLVFTFRTEEPVYPMRLTGAGADRNLSVELFVFGPSRASATGFSTAAAAPVQRFDIDTLFVRGFPTEKSVTIAHESLEKLVGRAAFATRLTATLRPEQMGEDVRFSWTEGGVVGRTAHSKKTLGWLAAAWAFGAGLVVLCVMGVVEKTTSARMGIAFAAAFIVGVSAAGLTLLLVPTVETVRVRGGRRPAEMFVREFVSQHTERANDARPAHTRAELESLVRESLSRFNMLESAEVRISDGPGGVQIREIDGWFYLSWVNAAGIVENYPVDLGVVQRPENEG